MKQKNVDQKQKLKGKKKFVVKQLLLKFLNNILFKIVYSGLELGSKIDTILSQTKHQQVELIETEMYSYFDLIEVRDDIEDLLREEKEKLRLKFQRKIKVIKEFIEKQNGEDPIIVNLMHALTIVIKKIANETIANLRKTICQSFQNFMNCMMEQMLHIQQAANQKLSFV